MAVEVQSNRLGVTVTWDESVDGELVQIVCFNPATGDVSQSAIRRNVGRGVLTYPQNFTGVTEITVFDNHDNSDRGVIEVAEGEATTVELEPSHPIEMPAQGVWPEEVEEGEATVEVAV